ncbi:MAG: hypothetical protein RLZZ546_3062 [Bacteroidota bacterium]
MTLRNRWRAYFKIESIVFIILGCIFVVTGLKGFMIPNKFLDGGILGISILLHEIYHIDISYLILLLNIPFIYIGYRKIGKSFGITTLIASIILIITFNLLHIETVTHDKILISIFGGFFIGLGLGFVMKAGAVLDGLEVIADYTNKKLGLSTGEIVLAINTIVISIAAYKFGIETGMYSILTYFTAMKVSDYVVDGFEEYTALTVISQKHEVLKDMIVNDFGKAISVQKGERGYLPYNMENIVNCDIIIVVLTRLELHRIKLAILEEDPTAFLYVHSIKEVKGGVVKQKVVKH